MAKQLLTLNHYFDDLAEEDYFESQGRTVTETDIILFAGLSGDHHQLHTDSEYAAMGPFGQRVAHGALTLALATGLEYAMMGQEENRVLAFYGMDRVRFVRPVFINDTIYLSGKITALEEKDEGRGIVTMHQEIKNQHGETVVSLEKRTLNMRRPGAGRRA